MADIRKKIGAKGTSYQVRYNSIKTKSGYAFVTFRTLKEARAFTESLGSHIEEISTHIRTVPQAVELWLEICEKIGRDGRETVEPATLEEYIRRGRVIKEYTWPKPLQALEPTDVVHFRNWLLANKSRDLARRTLSSFHSMIIEMKHQGHIRHDPASGISIKNSGRYETDAREIAIPSDVEMRDILGAADTLGLKNDFARNSWARYRPMIYLASFSGMRPSEYRGLPWTCVHSDRVEVRQRADKTGIIGPVKSKAGRRTIYLPNLVSDMLAEWKEECSSTDDDLVFPTSSGRPQLLAKFRMGAWLPLMRETGLVDLVTKNGKQIERTRYTLYSLRHYFASKLIEQGVDLKHLQDTMGHSKVEVTLNVYGHLMKGHEKAKKETAEALAVSVLENPCGEFVASDW